MDDTCETPSRMLGNKMRRLKLKTVGGSREPRPSINDDFLNSSIESDGHSPFLLTRKVSCIESPVDFSPLVTNYTNGSVSEFFPRSRTLPFLSRASNVDEDSDLEDVFNNENEELVSGQSLTALVQLDKNSKMSNSLSERRKRPLSSLASFDISENHSKHNRLNGTTPAKLTTENDVVRKLEKVDSKLIGDFSSNHALEVIPGPRAKFKYISVQSLAELMKYGQPNISEVVILDARYGYEFNGGHIQNAVNISSEGSHGRKVAESKMEQLFENKMEFNPDKRRIMVFHCEFSSERGPRMYNLFRSMDRNKHSYPKLIWPEIYLLKGGFKEFWDVYKDDRSLFGVHGYLAMLDNEKELNEVRKLRRKNKSLPVTFSKSRS